MSARESIENLWDRATPVGPLLDAYAHELAEKQRAEVRSGTFILRTERPQAPSALARAMGEHLADLIDPEKERP